jgi:dihydrodipicolinate synthase/N-acetylneuraminate lyase
MNWKGVIPAITTAFTKEYRVDPAFIAEHCRWLLDNGCAGIVALGSLGEGATLGYDEKLQILKTCVEASHSTAPVVAAISALSTSQAVKLAKAAADAGCDGLMVLPPYVYPGDWREMKAHVTAVFQATPLSCMLYNNPIAYGTDFVPEHIEELRTEYENFEAVKESSTDVRRITAIHALVGDALEILVGVDDAIVEGIAAGAVGWIAGLANALPRESAELFNCAVSGERQKASEIYGWFLPLLRMDTVPKFVQLIKLVQQEVGMGSARVRAPRLELSEEELDQTRKVIRHVLAQRPQIANYLTVPSTK